MKISCQLPVSSFQKKLFTSFLLLLFALPLTGAGADRFGTLGHRLMCSCGCGQVLLECNHVGCPRSDGMRTELAAGIDRGDSDDLVLQSFVQKYGATILAAPTATGFNRIAWIMPFVALAFGLAVAIFFIRRWGKQRSLAIPTPEPAALNPYQEQARRETEL
ncbi:MAG: cytochrome c-type biogenesis protein CcmH [Terriglobales bacterium]|jgi:cytochrome c-type biogenesis protein CcmH